jgi:hypothetical protein
MSRRGYLISDELKGAILHACSSVNPPAVNCTGKHLFAPRPRPLP